MKLRLHTFTTAAILGLTLQCSYVPKEADNSREQTSMSTSQTEDKVESKRRYDAMEGKIESLRQKLGLESLKVIQGRNELRVWVGFGMTQPRLFILKFSDGPQGSFYTLKTSQRNDGSTLDVPERKSLGQPRSGWTEFEKFLKTQGIASPMRLSRETSEYLRSPDVQVIAIEAKFKGKYNLVFFHLDNPSDDAQRALAVCRRIEHEFNINMYCGTSTG